MPYDLVIKNGVLIDGSGLPRYRADVAIRTAASSRPAGSASAAREVIDADGLVVTPGFIDGHTHMDAQVFWDPLGTSLVLARRHHRRHGQLRLHARALRAQAAKPWSCATSSAPRTSRGAAMAAGIDWSWTTFAEYLDALDALPKGINYAGYLGHSALRTYVMGERAFEQAATDDDLARDGARAARRHARRRDGLHHLTLADPRDLRRPAGGQPPRDVGRGAAARRRHGRDERGHLRAGRRGRRPRPERSRRPCANTTCGCATSRSRPAVRSPGASSTGSARPACSGSS